MTINQNWSNNCDHL